MTVTRPAPAKPLDESKRELLAVILDRPASRIARLPHGVEDSDEGQLLLRGLDLASKALEGRKHLEDILRAEQADSSLRVSQPGEKLALLRCLRLNEEMADLGDSAQIVGVGLGPQISKMPPILKNPREDVLKGCAHDDSRDRERAMVTELSNHPDVCRAA